MYEYECGVEANYESKYEQYKQGTCSIEQTKFKTFFKRFVNYILDLYEV